MKQWMAYIKKILYNGGFFALVIYFTYRMVFSKITFEQIGQALLEIKIHYLLLGLLTSFAMVCAEALNTKRNLKLLGVDKSYFLCLSYAFAGNFFSGITPAATGGQPMQLYLMHHDHVPASTGALALFMDLGAYQVVITSLGLFGFIFCFPIIQRSLGSFLPVLWVGLVLNTILLASTFIAMFSKKFSYGVVNFIANIVGALRKDKGESFQKKALQGVHQYQAGAAILKQHKMAYLANSCIMLFRVVAMHSAPFWVYKAFGLSGASFIEIIALQAALYVSCAALPFPGGTGIGEQAFLLYFKELFPAGILSSAMILSRGIGFYSVVTFCGIALFVLWVARQKQNNALAKGVKLYRKEPSEH